MSTPTPAVTPITYELMTMCMIRDHDQVLLINRPNSKGFPGFIAPGGKVENQAAGIDNQLRALQSRQSKNARRNWPGVLFAS